MAGSATLTMKKSRTIMNVPAMRTANADQLPVDSTCAETVSRATGRRTFDMVAVTEKTPSGARFVHLKDILESPPAGESSDSLLLARVPFASAFLSLSSLDFTVARRSRG